LAAALAVAALIGAGALAIHEHDARIQAADAARVRASTMAAQLRDAQAATAAVQAVADDASARLAAMTSIRQEVANAAPTSCSVPAAISAALDGLRARP
ncbi:MAG: hypothetical protein KGL35_21555, partial [Bradyrhizobium sp.]|nr:hypothetical protein [Bradyrhizobium sp.]